MFAVLLGLIAFSLLTFGAVSPHIWFLLHLLWLLIIAAYLTYQSISHKKLPATLCTCLALGVVLLAVLPAKLAVGLVAVLWSCAATLVNQTRVRRFLILLLFIGVFE